jgi:hypothetical protein
MSQGYEHVSLFAVKGFRNLLGRLDILKVYYSGVLFKRTPSTGNPFHNGGELFKRSLLAVQVQVQLQS